MRPIDHDGVDIDRLCLLRDEHQSPAKCPALSNRLVSAPGSGRRAYRAFNEPTRSAIPKSLRAVEGGQFQNAPRLDFAARSSNADESAAGMSRMMLNISALPPTVIVSTDKLHCTTFREEVHRA